jgi:uracil-DNA glycosylase
VGEAPGRDEELQGKPFVGKSGRLLDDIFTYAGFDMDRHIYISNVAKFYLPLLLEEIRLVNPSMIILAGATPLKALLDMTGITKVRGHWFSVELMGSVRMLMPIFHPSYLLRNATKKFDMKVRSHLPAVFRVGSAGRNPALTTPEI